MAGTDRKKSKPLQGDELPVENVSWLDVHQFFDRMNSRNDGYHLRLPTEAEWEYAARAGTTGPNTGSVGDVAWYSGNSEGHSHPVGQKKPNAWGLYDMEGNVYEWTQDWYFDYEEDALTDPTGPEMGISRVPRCVSWESSARGVRTSNRNMAEPPDRSYNIGFRLRASPSSKMRGSISRRSFMMLPALASLDVLAGVRPDEYTFHYDHILGTSMDLALWMPSGGSDAAAQRVAKSALNEVHRLSEILNTRNPESEISRFDRGDTAAISRELPEVLPPLRIVGDANQRSIVRAPTWDQTRH